MADSNIRIISYNVLSSSFGVPSHFSLCDPEHCEANSRLAIVKEKLSGEIERGSIICLQEVSMEWQAELAVLFANAGYFFTTGLYGGGYSGYMGVGLAFPMARYVLEDSEMARVSDTKKWARQPRPSKLSSFLSSLFRPLIAICKWFMQRIGAMPMLPADFLWTKAKRRWNRAIAHKLSIRDASTGISSGQPFWVATYHMPCAFRDPPVMVLHASMVASWLQRLAAASGPNGAPTPYVLAGDFNFKPGSPVYNLLTQNTVEDGLWLPSRPKYDTGAWTPSLPRGPLCSAYALASADGATEPEYTNYPGADADFCATLDYLFLSTGEGEGGCQWDVIDVLPITPLAEQPGRLPNAAEPSDHVMIGATLSIRPPPSPKGSETEC